MKLSLAIALLTCLAAAAEVPKEMRVWTGTNGRTFRGLADPQSLPEYYRKNGARFFMTPSTRDAAFVIGPFVFAKPPSKAGAA